MKKIEKVIKVIKNPELILLILSLKNIIKLPDVFFLKCRYKYIFDKELNLENPLTFNEKLQWLKLNDREDIYITMVDKYDAKKYVSDIIGKEYIIPTIGVYDSFDEINFDILPNQFVIKCTHDSGGVVICKDKSTLNIKMAKKKINKSLKVNYYWAGREWPYKNIKPRILIENYMEDTKTKELRDYKFFCFNGNCKCFKIDFDRQTNHRANYYDKRGKLLKFGEIICPPDYYKKIDMPMNLSKMIELAEKLSTNNKFLRVDFYEINDKIYFGELTFYPASGFGKFTDEQWDLKLGEWIDLSK